ncbi:TraR/DksA family transcriptional regulator [Providencia manganoxydans]|uniref:TraR/DksA family transcriptional regulator n=1 Tax=Providencia manganoxydans TaxID=2923283 RepID=UPI0034E3D919
MSKEIDIASEQEELLRSHQINAIVGRPVGVTAFICENCDRPIPEGRRIASPGCTLCIDCQTLSELKSKHYRSV